MSYFSDLGLAEPILRALESKGYNDPTPIQRQSIPALMEGREDPAVIVVRRKTTDAQDLAAAEKNLEGQARAAAKQEKIDGMRELSIGPDGRPRAQLSL